MPLLGGDFCQKCGFNIYIVQVHINYEFTQPLKGCLLRKIANNDKKLCSQQFLIDSTNLFPDLNKTIFLDFFLAFKAQIKCLDRFALLTFKIEPFKPKNV